MQPCAWASGRELPWRSGPPDLFAFPFSNPAQATLLGDAEVESLFGSEIMLRRMLDFEVALTLALHAEGEISEDVCTRTTACIGGMKLKVDRISVAAERDGVVVPELVNQVRQALPEDCRRDFHRGATSQDLIDTALAIALRDFHDIVAGRLDALNSALERLKSEFGEVEIPARTRMQNAGMLRAADRIDGWRRPVEELIGELPSMRDRIAVLQFAGPLGVRRNLGLENPRGIAERMAGQLGLSDIGAGWQTDRRRLATYASWLAALTGCLGKIGRDCCLMAQAGELRHSGGGRSSAIPGKQNPVRSEVLVALAKFNAVLVSGMLHGMDHEQERSGSAWTLEWMILPQICVASAAALRSAPVALDRITDLGAPEVIRRTQ